MDLKQAKTYLAQKNNDVREEKVESKTGQVLDDRNRAGKKRPWQKKKLENIRYAEYLKILEFKKEFKVKECAEVLNYQIDESGQAKLYQVYFCKSRLCPLCNWRRAIKSSKQLEMILTNAVLDYPQAQFLFLTLTTKNVFGKENLKVELAKMGRAVAKLMQYKKVKKNVLGYVRSTEITVSKDGSYNQHMHVLVMVKASFFNDKENYITQKEWRSLWQKAMKLDYDPRVFVEKVSDKSGKGSLTSAAFETAKYQAKSADYLTSDDAKNLKIIDDFEYALRGTRQISYAGVLKEIHKKLHLDDAEKGDLVHADGKLEDEKQVVRIAVAKFDYIRKNYFWT